MKTDEELPDDPMWDLEVESHEYLPEDEFED